MMTAFPVKLPYIADGLMDPAILGVVLEPPKGRFPIRGQFLRGVFAFEVAPMALIVFVTTAAVPSVEPVFGSRSGWVCASENAAVSVHVVGKEALPLTSARRLCRDV